MSGRLLKFLFLVLILLIPVIIFLFLKGAGDNQFAIPVYYENGVPEAQQFDCAFQPGPYSISWPDTLAVGQTALMYFSDGNNGPDAVQKRNMIRRIMENSRTELDVLVFFSGNADIDIDGIRRIRLEQDRLKPVLHCLAASDTLDQFILSDQAGRIRGYYGTSVKEQDRLLVELKILAEEEL